MSKSDDQARPHIPVSLRSSQQEYRRRGSAFGIQYDLALRITTISDPEMEAARLPLPQESLLLEAPVAGEVAESPAGDGIGRWESEGGR